METPHSLIDKTVNLDKFPCLERGSLFLQTTHHIENRGNTHTNTTKLSFCPVIIVVDRAEIVVDRLKNAYF